ncbi:hypothetical protein PAXINDRAFT_100841 [Paxillus involutus ATCC 200175]|uniref:Uncharacterized protein n=1 Tax=Paxillus involutus ATCC 200175 TaxID=664439 RepID=A0A0C9U0X7_PAXIN|nr:hypothetical protein PAXINDRAFT_100841 [Paxillus involutus ATCC 200175]
MLTVTDLLAMCLLGWIRTHADSITRIPGEVEWLDEELDGGGMLHNPFIGRKLWYGGSIILTRLSGHCLQVELATILETHNKSFILFTDHGVHEFPSDNPIAIFWLGSLLPTPWSLVEFNKKHHRQSSIIRNSPNVAVAQAAAQHKDRMFKSPSIYEFVNKGSTTDGLKMF